MLTSNEKAILKTIIKRFDRKEILKAVAALEKKG
jgi:hypothetical protein